jgi:hypothetical protein
VVEGLSPKVLQLALRAADAATKQGKGNLKILGIIDFSLPSSTKRFWILDLEREAVLFHEYVAHGRGSGDKFARAFSNEPKSYKSSLGLFLTESSYFGKHGYSLYLRGLEKGVNDKAKSRAIVIHSAWYVSEDMIKKTGRIGRSQGCPAVESSVVNPLIDTLKEGNLIFAYYPDENWLSSSKFLN